MQNLTGFGLIVSLQASNTFPSGIILTQFADDADPLDFASVKFADSAMGLNGDLIIWAKAIPLPMVLNVIPAGQDDQNLQILANANRVGLNKASAYDVITASVQYPDGSQTTVINGVMTDAMFGSSVASAGRLKTKSYTFMFENRVGA
jgi:hypothetical protein